MDTLTSVTPATQQVSYAGMIVLGLLCCLVLAIVSIVIATIVQRKNQHTPSTEGSLTAISGSGWAGLFSPGW